MKRRRELLIQGSNNSRTKAVAAHLQNTVIQDSKNFLHQIIGLISPLDELKQGYCHHKLTPENNTRDNRQDFKKRSIKQHVLTVDFCSSFGNTSFNSSSNKCRENSSGSIRTNYEHVQQIIVAEEGGGNQERMEWRTVADD